jgi:antitoxin YokJ
VVDVGDLIDLLRRRADCVVEKPIGMPTLAPGHNLPDDVASFYAACGGLELQSLPLRIVSPARFLPINEVVLAEQFAGDASAGWYLAAESDTSGTAERVSIDLRSGYAGRCYDSFWDRHGIRGSMPIIALSFTAFLARVASDGIYWTSERFAPLGDA